MDPSNPYSAGGLGPDPSSPNRLKLIAIAIGALLLIGLVVVVALSLQKKGSTANPTPIPGIPTPHPVTAGDPASDPTHPAADVINVVSKYINIRENAVGANQATPTSWIASEQSLSTPAWYAQLQPQPDGTTPGDYGEFVTAHNNGYLVKANLSGCIWDIEAATPTTTSGVIYCDLTDTTIDQKTGNSISSANLPAGWMHTGSQDNIKLKMVKDVNGWLIDDDNSSDPF